MILRLLHTIDSFFTVVTTKLWHTFVGLFIWEFFTTLDYEWNIIRGHRPYRWTIWLYSTTRVATLVAVVLIIVDQDVMRQHNCQVTISFLLIFMYLAFSTASLLVVLRIIAIWNRKKVIVWIAFGLWLNNIAFLILSAIRARSVWMPAETACVMTDIEQNRITVFVTIVTDLVLLFIMVVGTLCLCRDEGGKFGLARLLWRQGVIWLSIGIATEIPPGVLMVLNLNYPLNVILQPPSIIAMSVVATRMHRSLTDFARGTADIPSDSFRRHHLEFVKTEQTPAGQTFLGAMEVTVHISSEGHPASQTIHLSSTVGVDSQPCSNSLSESSVHCDLESGMGK